MTDIDDVDLEVVEEGQRRFWRRESAKERELEMYRDTENTEIHFNIALEEQMNLSNWRYNKKFKFDFVELKVRKCFSTTDCTDYTDFWASAAPAIRIVLHPAIVASCDEKSV